MPLTPATDEHLRELMTWFPDRESCRVWGGPSFRHPFTEATFREDAHWEELPSYSLVGGSGELLGFGQFYRRWDRCHLGRLVVSPHHRRRGLGAVLVDGLAALGRKRLAAQECSLIVMAANVPAVHLYRKLGFEPVAWPDPDGIPGALFMVWRCGPGT